MADGETFDCFLSHNSRDKPAVRALAADLRARGVSVWLDEEQLCPGEPWQRLLGDGIRAARSVAVLVGADGLGPWEQEEMCAALTLAVRERRRVIPVLLPAAPTAPELPLFLAERTWVDLRQAADPGGLSGLDRLVWGITGRRPEVMDLTIASIHPQTVISEISMTPLFVLVALGLSVWYFWPLLQPVDWAVLRGWVSTGPAVLAHPADLDRFSDAMKSGGQTPEMIAIPTGCFQMGSLPDEPGRWADEDPQHQVCLGRFAIGRTEVTFDQYDRFAESTGRKKPDDAGWGRGDRPAINVTWQDAVDYAEWLSTQTGHQYRLPTEAEWEYAARAGTMGPFWTGNCIHTDQANYDGSYDYAGCGARTGVYRRQTVPAGSLPANPWGLHEVTGNVFEWVQDCLHKDYNDAPTDGSAWLESGGGDCARRMVRGGSWYGYPKRLRSANRIRFPRDAALNTMGFRLARSL